MFIVTAVAMLSPHTAPNAAHAPTVAMARPPRRCPSHLSKVSNAAAMTPPAPAMTPISTNSGMMTRIGEVDTSKIVLAGSISAAGRPRVRMKPTNPPIIIERPTWSLRNMRPKKTPAPMMPQAHSGRVLMAASPRPMARSSRTT